MSITAAELSKKISSDTNTSSQGKKPQGNFRKLLEVSPIDEHHHHSLFSLIEEEEEEEKESASLPLESGCTPPPVLGITAAEEKESASLPLESGCTPPPVLGITAAEEKRTITPSLSTGLSANMEALFEKMASRMMVMDLSSETHTTLFLDQPQFSGSSFFGTTIIIKEFTTAPKAFNIEIISNPTAIGTIQKNQEHLLSIFTQGNFNFKVHRLDTQIEQDSTRPILHRHEEGESQGQKEKHKDQHS